MNTNRKAFLVPVVAAIAALTSTPSFSGQQKVTTSAGDDSTNTTAKSTQDLSERLVQIARGDELHNLILKSSESGQTLAYHYSHSSHRSHSSHYSSRY